MLPKCVGCGARDRFMSLVAELERQSGPTGLVVGMDQVLLVMCRDCGTVSGVLPYRDLPQGPISLEEQETGLRQLETTLEKGLEAGDDPAKTP
jgi:hypothetical protein